MKRSGALPARAMAAAAALIWLAAACSAGGVEPLAEESTTTSSTSTAAVTESTLATSLPDLSARPLDTADLMAMLPPGGNGVASGSAQAAERGNQALLAASVLDPVDEAADLAGFGRVTGVTASYPASDHEAYVWVDLLVDADSAHGYLLDTAQDIAKRIGGSHAPDIDLVYATDFSVGGVGDEALGMRLTLADSPTGRTPGEEGTDTETLILFRSGRLVGFASVVRPGQADDRVGVQYLAEELAARMLAVMLQREPAVPDPAGPGAYGFSYELVAASATSSWSLNAEGRAVGDGLTCRMRANGPGVSLDRDLLMVGDRLWARDHDLGQYREVGGGNTGERALLALCPAWPPGAADAGLAALVSGEPARYVISGVDVLGYRGDAAGLAAATGADLGASTVDVFSFWIAAQTSWVMEVDLSLSGEATDLAPLLGPLPVPAGQITLTARHRLDLGAGTDPILPPS
jgi:hypothetical protein